MPEREVLQQWYEEQIAARVNAGDEKKETTEANKTTTDGLKPEVCTSLINIACQARPLVHDKPS